jgi:hypothetical protein
MTRSQGMLAIERMCTLAGVSRAGYYRRWQASAPRQEEMGLRDAIQRLALAFKQEEVDGRAYRDIAAARGAIARFIDDHDGGSRRPMG